MLVAEAPKQVLANYGLGESPVIEPSHVSEAIQYRTLDRNFWRSERMPSISRMHQTVTIEIVP